MDVIDVVDDNFYVAVGGVFPFDDLNLSVSAVCEVFN